MVVCSFKSSSPFSERSHASKLPRSRSTGPYDRSHNYLEGTHTAKGRKLFASGVVDAALNGERPLRIANRTQYKKYLFNEFILKSLHEVEQRNAAPDWP